MMLKLLTPFLNTLLPFLLPSLLVPSQPLHPCRLGPPSEFRPLDVDDIVKEIEHLKTGKSCGRITYAEFLKGTKEVIALPLKLLFEISIKTSLLPFEWKRALVCPIHKSGPKSVVFVRYF